MHPEASSNNADLLNALHSIAQAIGMEGYKIVGYFETIEAVQGTNFTTTSASYVDTGVTESFTTGNKPEIVVFWIGGMAQVNAVTASTVTAGVNGIDRIDDVAWYPSGNGEWGVYSKMYIANFASNTAVTLKTRGKTGAGTLTIIRVGQYAQQSIKGFRLVAN